MNALHTRSALPGLALLVLTAVLSACQSSAACDTAARLNTVIVALHGDDSQVAGVFVCATDVKECVVPRRPDEPVVSRAPGPWSVPVNPAGATPAETDVYVVDPNDQVLAKQRVSLVWTTDQADDRCGTTFKATTTVSLTETKWERG